MPGLRASRRRATLVAAGAVLAASAAALAVVPARAPAPAPLSRALSPPAQAAAPARRGVSILQIGDSHTAADLFTGAARLVLQERHGRGGPGYLPPGRPHPGVLSTQLKVSASPGWSYESLQRSATPERFALSGYNASAGHDGETLSFASEAPVAYSLIEIEARRGPEAGGIAVELDGRPVLAANLAGEEGPALFRIGPPEGRRGSFGRLVVRSTGPRPVTLSGLGVYRPDRGVTYSSLGFPGATVDILGRVPPAALADALGRLRPDIVVLAFGTNEGFDDSLDPAAYRERYAAVLRAIRRAAPRARLVMIGPPQADRVCKPGAASAGCTAQAQAQASGEAPAGAGRPCPHRPPPGLDRVREVQRALAERERIPFWDWAALMPSPCGPERWFSAVPPLMARDHVHFTKAGYNLSGRSFAEFLDPVVSRLLRDEHVVPND